MNEADLPHDFWPVRDNNIYKQLHTRLGYYDKLPLPLKRQFKLRVPLTIDFDVNAFVRVVRMDERFSPSLRCGQFDFNKLRETLTVTPFTKEPYQRNPLICKDPNINIQVDLDEDGGIYTFVLDD